MTGDSFLSLVCEAQEWQTAQFAVGTLREVDGEIHATEVTSS